MSNQQKKRYELLQVGDVIQDGDEFWNPKEKVWERYSSLASGWDIAATLHPSRRTLSIPATEPVVKPEVTPEVPEGYRLLGPDEVIQEGDQWKNEGFSDRCWDDYCLSEHCGKTVRDLSGFLFRRPVTTSNTAPTTPNETEKEPEKVSAKGPGEGYRWVNVGETLEEGDEYDDFGRWAETVCVGDRVNKQTKDTYRRKVPVTVPAPEPARPPQSNPPSIALPEGYRFLEVGEVILAGDLVFDGSPDRKTWGPTALISGAHWVLKNFDERCYARKKKEAATPPVPACPLRWMLNGTGKLQWFDGKNWMDVPWESAKETKVNPTTVTGGGL